MNLLGAKLQAINADSLVKWLTEKIIPENTPNTMLALVHTDEGITWGRYTNNNWDFSSDAYPEISPQISTHNLITARLFNENLEYLIWRSDDGFLARQIEDVPTNEEWAKPFEETMIVLGNKYGNENKGFTLVKDNSGRSQAVPFENIENLFDDTCYPLQLRVKHYLEEHELTGTLRIAATRLIALEQRTGGQ